VRRRRRRARARFRDLVALLVALVLLACASVLVLVPDAAPRGSVEPAVSESSLTEADEGAEGGGLPASDAEATGEDEAGLTSDGRSVRRTATGTIATWTEEGELPEVASAVLSDYQGAGSCVLVHAGYLDLLGNVWGCTVTGDGWVDTCLVSEKGGSCEVRRRRVETAKAEAAYGREEAVDG
jgi:hypothetical protein